MVNTFGGVAEDEVHRPQPTLKQPEGAPSSKGKILEDKCSSCGLTEWLGNPLSLHLDHIDGNNHNHVKSNLRLLCPNCHSQTDTWCGKNK